MRQFTVLLLVLLAPADVAGQFNPNNLNAYQRRAIREQAVAWAGAQARAFVETGDEAALALLACTPSGARKLVEFHSSGALGRVPRPPDLLCCIAMYRDDVLLFAVQHAEELTDTDRFDAFIQAPLDYALELKSLEQGAAEVRAVKLSFYARAAQPWNAKPIVLFAGIAAIIGLVAWRRRRNRHGIGV